jgi:hypothetical protein
MTGSDDDDIVLFGEGHGYFYFTEEDKRGLKRLERV